MIKEYTIKPKTYLFVIVKGMPILSVVDFENMWQVFGVEQVHFEVGTDRSNFIMFIKGEKAPEDWARTVFKNIDNRYRKDNSNLKGVIN